MTTDSVIYIIGTGVAGALAATVRHLFKIVMQNKTDIQTELQECQDDRKKLWKEIADLNSRVPKRDSEETGSMKAVGA